MKINDIEKLTGLKRSNIFYYEREGLIAPSREDNNYREYNEDDLRRLKTIVVLRKLGFTVAEIKALLDGERTLAEILPENLARLEDKEAELGEAINLCLRRGIFLPAAGRRAVAQPEQQLHHRGGRDCAGGGPLRPAQVLLPAHAHGWNRGPSPV